MDREINEEEIHERTPSVIITQLRELEQQFFDIVQSGNVTAAKQFYEETNVNINASNFEGVTALNIAVRDRNIAMIEYLLSLADLEPGDAHLHAIRENEPRIALMIMNKLNEIEAGSEFDGVTRSTDFPDGATPLIVAAQCGHFEIIRLLMHRRHSIQLPHPPGCNCQECKTDREELDILWIAKNRLYVYEAISNPAYICQTVEDPILRAFKLSYELDQAASFDPEFFHQYNTLSESVSQFATDLIACARTAEEVEVILKQTTEFAHSSKFTYPRLLFALHFEQRTFVAHPNVQQLVESKWSEGWYEWKTMSGWRQILCILLRIPILPIIALVFIIRPNSKLAKNWKTPVNKFVSSTGSYFVFLAFVFLQSNVDKTEQLRGAPDTGYEWVLAIYVIAFFWAAVRLCILHGPKRFFATAQYWYEVVMIILFILTFLFWITAAIDVRINGQRELERKYWHRFDPSLIAEGIYCLATIMAFLKLLFICQLNYHLGPLQQSLMQMVKDVLKFTLLFSIIMFAFAAGLCRLYQYYDGMVQTDDKSKIETEQVSSFVSLPSTVKTLFWAVFAMSPTESSDVIIENLPGDSESETIINHHSFTESIGLFSFAVYSVISVIVVLNMLIACMSNTFTRITDNVIVEWTFGRTKVYVDYMCSTPFPPLNLVPTVDGMKSIIEYIKVLVKRPHDKRARWDFNHCWYIDILSKDKDEQFSEVMSQLVQRYFREKSKKENDSEMEKLREEITEVRTLLRDALSSA